MVNRRSRPRLPARPKLSSTSLARSWLGQFRTIDQIAAARLIDALLLLNDDDVAAAIRSELRKLALSRSGKRRKVALYTEREIAESVMFQSKRLPGRDGKVRLRAFGDRGPAAVKPVRGRARVGSEGWTAFLISQAQERSPGIYLNHPGPDRIRRNKASLIVIVTDFIGSGGRIAAMLDKFLAVPSVRAWRSNKWIEFAVVAAAGTRAGIQSVRQHRAKPTVLVTHVVASLATSPDRGLAETWRRLTHRYGPPQARGAGPEGYKDGGALVAFSYRTPNNTPLLLHKGDRSWRPLFQGPPDDDLRLAFGLPPLKERAEAAAEATGHELAPDLSAEEQRMIVVLRSIRGRWRLGQEIGIAERTGLTVPDVVQSKNLAEAAGLLTTTGHLTDDGQRLVRAGTTMEENRPDIPTRMEPYYPLALRTPR